MNSGEMAVPTTCERFPAAAENRAERVSGPETVGSRERLAQQHLVRPPDRGIAAALQHEPIQHVTRSLGDRDQPPVSRLS